VNTILKGWFLPTKYTEKTQRVLFNYKIAVSGYVKNCGVKWPVGRVVRNFEKSKE
jgi:hypothetical protein